MCGYMTYQDAELQPKEPPATIDVDCLQECVHAFACERVYKRCVDDSRKYGWLVDMARSLACGRCDIYEERR